VAGERVPEVVKPDAFDPCSDHAKAHGWEPVPGLPQPSDTPETLGSPMLETPHHDAQEPLESVRTHGAL
jgi:hypothetical protein